MCYFIVLLTLDLFSNTNFIVNAKTKQKKNARNMMCQLRILLVTSIKTSKKVFSFIYLQKENTLHQK